MDQNVRKISQKNPVQTELSAPCQRKREGERERERMEEETTKKMETGIEEEAKEQEMGGLREGKKRGKQRRKSGRKGRANFIRLLPKCRTSVFHQSFSFQGKKPSAQAA